MKLSAVQKKALSTHRISIEIFYLIIEDQTFMLIRNNKHSAKVPDYLTTSPSFVNLKHGHLIHADNGIDLLFNIIVIAYKSFQYILNPLKKRLSSPFNKEKDKTDASERYIIHDQNYLDDTICIYANSNTAKNTESLLNILNFRKWIFD